MHTLNNTHINKVRADACTNQGRIHRLAYICNNSYGLHMNVKIFGGFHQNTCKNIVHYSRIKQQKENTQYLCLTIGHIYEFTADPVCKYKISM